MSMGWKRFLPAYVKFTRRFIFIESLNWIKARQWVDDEKARLGKSFGPGFRELGKIVGCGFYPSTKYV